ncbi:MAG TPA: tetratricopeptide repeat protein [Steroidobacteraceae bacterium]|nr:tetratricopeptide repeat protein [Steroidobacteraceae bacterium]
MSNDCALCGGARPIVTTPCRRAYRIERRARPGDGRHGKMRYDYGMGLLYLLLPYLLQGTAIVHCIKTGRNSLWIWVLIWPGIGAVAALAYIAIEILPDLFRSSTAQRTARGFKRAVDPFGDLRRFENEARLAGNVASKQRYADELVRHGRYEEAIEQYRQALTGLYVHDPNLLLGLARAQFGSGAAAAARATLEDALNSNPDFRSPEAHLLYARALEGEGSVQKALEQYRTLANSYPGAEAAVRYAQLLDTQGQRDEARKVARDLLDQARIAPGHYRRAQRAWLDLAARLAG